MVKGKVDLNYLMYGNPGECINILKMINLNIHIYFGEELIQYCSPHLLYPQTKVGDILDSGPSRRRRRRRRRNFLVDAITQKQINIFFSNLVHMLRVPKGRSLF